MHNKFQTDANIISLTWPWYDGTAEAGRVATFRHWICPSTFCTWDCWALVRSLMCSKSRILCRLTTDDSHWSEIRTGSVQWVHRQL